MSEPGEKTFEGVVLDAHPALRARVEQSPEFQAWKAGVRSIEVDSVTNYIRGGDMLVDEDQLIFEWAHRAGWLPPDVLKRLTPE